jgi:hypothetical protein
MNEEKLLTQPNNMITKYNISKPDKYLKDGEEKTFWQNVGTYTEFEKDGKVSRVVEIPAIGLKAQVFPIKKEEDKPEQKTNSRY